MANLIQTKGLCKRYGSAMRVKDLSRRVRSTAFWARTVRANPQHSK